MTVTRQRNKEEDENSKEEALNLDANRDTTSQQTPDNASIQITVEEKDSPPSKHMSATRIIESFAIVNHEPLPLSPPAALNENMLVFSKEISEMMKIVLGIKSSSHDVDIVSYNEVDCDIVLSPDSPHDHDLNQLPGKGKACYLFTPNKKIYYADKQRKHCTNIPINPQVFDSLCQSLEIKLVEPIQCNDFSCLAESLSTEHLQKITLAIKHMHGMGFYKKNSIDSVMSPLEVANSTAYQLFGPRHFPTCYAVLNAEQKYIGVFSKLLPGFKPNRDKPLLPEDLVISSLQNMIKFRDEEHDIKELGQVFETLKNLIPLMIRVTNPTNSWFYQVWEAGKNNCNYYLGNSYLGNPYCAVIVKPQFEKFLTKDKHSVTFGELDSLRQLLVNRKNNIVETQKSYVAVLHQHDLELLLLDSAIDQLSLILLDEIAIFITHLHRISRELQDNWVNIEAEMANPKSKYANIQITKGLTITLDIPLAVILHYRNNCGLAIGLTSRYFMMDPDGHAKNLSSNGCNVDGDLAIYPLTYRFKNPRGKPGDKDFVLDINDFLKFPNITTAYFRYWPTLVTLADTSIDTAFSMACDVTKNYFSDQDNINYKSLEISPVFNFQKYIQLIICAITSKNMFSVCAELHMKDKLQMLNDDGNTASPIPLLSDNGIKQDVMTKWIEYLSDRSLEARKLAKQLLPIKKILERHSGLVLEMILDSFDLFLKDKKMELNADAFQLLEITMQPVAIGKAFYQLKKEILSDEKMPICRFFNCESSSAYTRGAAAGALSKGESSQINSAGISRYIGSFLDSRDGASLAITCKKAMEDAEGETVENMVKNKR